MDTWNPVLPIAASLGPALEYGADGLGLRYALTGVSIGWHADLERSRPWQKSYSREEP